MAGSLAHLVNEVDPDGVPVDPELPAGEFTFWRIENFADAYEASEECFDLIVYLAGGDSDRIRAACRALGLPAPAADLRSERAEAALASGGPA